MKQCFLYTAIWYLLLISSFSSMAQSNPPTRANLESPYHTVLTHLHFLQKNSYQPNLSSRTIYGVHDAPKAQEFASHLKRVLDGKGLYVEMETLPKDRNYIDSTSKHSIYTLFPMELPEVYVEKIGGKWYYSKETVEAIPRLYQQTFPFGDAFNIDFLQSDTQPKLFDIKMSQYIILLIVFLVSFILHFLLKRFFRFFIGRMAATRFGQAYIKKDLILKAAAALSLVVVTQTLIMLLPLAQLSIAVSKYLILSLKIAVTVFMVIFMLRMLDIFVAYSSKVVERTKNTLDDQLLPLLRTILQMIVTFLGFLYILQILNVNITALLAGISIGGLAIALAAQDTVKNLFGSLMIFIDRPFQIGDWISFGGYDGQVEAVGLRSTRVRTFSNSLLYVPNATFTDTVINNVGMRIYRRFKTNLSIPYDTPPELIESFVKGLRVILCEHPDTKKDASKVFLNSMEPSSLNILMVTFFHVPGWNEELNAKQEIVLSILKLAKALNIQYAYPLNTTKFSEPITSESTDISKTEILLDDFLKDWRTQMGLRKANTGDNTESLGNEGDG
ncbi:MAG: mechanosensitive ion channel family protein [Chitinophagales bacterium]